MNLTTKQKKALKHLKIRPFDKDLRRFSLKEIKREFSAKTSGRILMAPLHLSRADLQELDINTVRLLFPLPCKIRISPVSSL